ncbi:MAG: crossover junction endodeoxyribonuclease RuvC [Elusimicrobia bacterium]|nr:crossover junction endodeoxyribonuclease RuvC [Elusimicrobiota bacterium]
MTAQKVLGIDPGIATTGWGFVEKAPPDRFLTVRFGCLLTPAKEPMVQRLRHLAEQLRRLVQAEKPDVAAVEELYFAKDSRTAASVGHARGVILLVLSELGLPVYEYNPRQVKMALTGYGAADKSQMQRMVQRLLSLKEIPKPDDAADALAIALCHLQTLQLPA